jgi:mannose-6-phosphate isomerase-like protein (cupin superfamily)
MIYSDFESFLSAVAPDAEVHEDGFTAEEARHKGGIHATAHAQKKPWGGEIWHIFGDRIVLKTLFVSPDQRLSYQSHNEKEEAWIFQTKGWAILEGEEMEFLPGAVVHIAPGTKHRLISKGSAVIVTEASTHELMDVVRYEDDYGREK